MGQARSPRHRRTLGRSALTLTLAGASVLQCACGSSRPPTILNTEKVERAIERSIMAQRGERAQVSCPSGVQQTKHWIFSCTATVGRSGTRFVVTELDGSGDVHYEAR